MHRVVSSLLAVLLVAGCSAFRAGQNRIAADVAEVEVEESQYAYFEFVTVRSTDGATEITGWIRSRHPYSSVFPGHINVSIIAADGELVDAFEVAYSLRPRPRKTMRVGTFRAVVPYDLEPETRIRLAYHYGLLKRAHRE